MLTCPSWTSPAVFSYGGAQPCAESPSVDVTRLSAPAAAVLELAATLRGNVTFASVFPLRSLCTRRPIQALSLPTHALSLTSRTATAAPLGCDPATTKYTYEQLLARPEHLPREKLHLFLSDTDFVTVFGMQPAEFERLPKWKKDKARQAKGLF